MLKTRLARTDRRGERARLLRLISKIWDVDGPALLAEYHRSPFAGWYQGRVREVRARLGAARMGTSDDFSCEALYLLVRAARPRVVVETGVLCSVTTACTPSST